MRDGEIQSLNASEGYRAARCSCFFWQKISAGRTEAWTAVHAQIPRARRCKPGAPGVTLFRPVGPTSNRFFAKSTAGRRRADLDRSVRGYKRCRRPRAPASKSGFRESGAPKSHPFGGWRSAGDQKCGAVSPMPASPRREQIQVRKRPEARESQLDPAARACPDLPRFQGSRARPRKSFPRLPGKWRRSSTGPRATGHG